MPRFDEDTEFKSYTIGGTTYGFSAARIDDLGASEYTLVDIVADVSSSVYGFRDGIEKVVKEVLRSCRHSPRADNLLVRFTTFNSRVHEVHGFRPLTECDEDKYTGSINPSGSTALFEAVYNAVEAGATYGQDLMRNDFDVNAIVVVITDGEDNISKMTPTEVGKAVVNARQSEALESIKTILVGLNTDNNLSTYLDNFKTGAGIDQYVDAGSATAQTLAKLADFISRSISAQSQSLGTGGASQSLSF